MSRSATDYANNKVQWFFEEVQLPRIVEDDVGELAIELYEEMHDRGLSPESVDWRLVEQGLSRFLSASAKMIVDRIREDLSNEES